MCYYNGQKVTHVEFIRLKQLEKALAHYDFLNEPMQQGFDYGPNVVLKRIPNQEDFDIVQMEWGFLPPYWKTREEAKKYRTGFMDGNGKFVQYLTLNAMSEEMLLPKKMYRQAALDRRCLVLSSGFYEWRHIYRINKRTGQPLKTADKYPYHITLKDQPYFYIAGVWQAWTDQSTGESVETFALVTTAANTLMEQIHNSKKRMPTILTEDLAYEWLLGTPTEERITEIGRFQYPSRAMQACLVDKNFRTALDPSLAIENEDVPALENV